MISAEEYNIWYLIFSNWHKQRLTQYAIFQPKAYADMTKCYLVWYRQQCERVEIKPKISKEKKNKITNFKWFTKQHKTGFMLYCLHQLSFLFCSNENKTNILCSCNFTTFARFSQMFWSSWTFTYQILFIRIML